MSGKAGLNLSGRWSGIYNYPEFYPPNGFEAILSDVDGAIGGTILEQGNSNGVIRTLNSLIEGRRHGSTVTFTKMYEDVELMPHAIFYSGTIEPDGNEISGRWEIPGAWSGTFIMIRASGVAEAAEEQASERLEL